MTKNIIFDIETMGLEPMNDRILCAGVFIIQYRKNCQIEETKMLYSENEKDVLSSFWNVVENGDALVTFNGDRFDIPFLLKRSIIHNIKTKKFVSIDLRKIANGDGLQEDKYDKYKKGSLADWANILGFQVSTMGGEMMPILYQNKEWNEITKHCQEDIDITVALYKRLKEVGLI